MATALPSAIRRSTVSTSASKISRVPVTWIIGPHRICRVPTCQNRDAGAIATTTLGTATVQAALFATCRRKLLAPREAVWKLSNSFPVQMPTLHTHKHTHTRSLSFSTRKTYLHNPHTGRIDFPLCPILIRMPNPKP